MNTMDKEILAGQKQIIGSESSKKDQKTPLENTPKYQDTKAALNLFNAHGNNIIDAEATPPNNRYVDPTNLNSMMIDNISKEDSKQESIQVGDTNVNIFNNNNLEVQLEDIDYSGRNDDSLRQLNSIEQEIDVIARKKNEVPRNNIIERFNSPSINAHNDKSSSS